MSANTNMLKSVYNYYVNGKTQIPRIMPGIVSSVESPRVADIIKKYVGEYISIYIDGFSAGEENIELVYLESDLFEKLDNNISKNFIIAVSNSKIFCINKGDIFYLVRKHIRKTAIVHTDNNCFILRCYMDDYMYVDDFVFKKREQCNYVKDHLIIIHGDTEI